MHPGDGVELTALLVELGDGAILDDAQPAGELLQEGPALAQGSRPAPAASSPA